MDSNISTLMRHGRQWAIGQAKGQDDEVIISCRGVKISLLLISLSDAHLVEGIATFKTVAPRWCSKADKVKGEVKDSGFWWLCHLGQSLRDLSFSMKKNHSPVVEQECQIILAGRNQFMLVSNAFICGGDKKVQMALAKAGGQCYSAESGSHCSSIA